MSSPLIQQVIAFGIVAVAAGWIAWRAFLRFGAAPLAAFLLRHGQVKSAMRLKHWGRKNCCP